MRLPQDRILHIDTELAGGEVRVVAELQGEVVRCKDCRWFKQDSSPVGYGYCDGRMVGREVDYNDFCSFGERAEQTNDDMFGIKDMLDKLTLRGDDHD